MSDDEIVTGEAHDLLTGIKAAMERQDLLVIVLLTRRLAVVDPESAQMVLDVIAIGSDA